MSDTAKNWSGYFNAGRGAGIVTSMSLCCLSSVCWPVYTTIQRTYSWTVSSVMDCSYLTSPHVISSELNGTERDPFLKTEILRSAHCLKYCDEYVFCVLVCLSVRSHNSAELHRIFVRIACGRGSVLL